MARGVRPVSVWAELAERSSIGSYVPVLRQDLEWARLKTRHGKPNVMLADRPRKYLRLTERDDFLAQRMDGTRRVSDLVVDYFTAYGRFGLKQVSDLVTTLRRSGFLADPPRDVWADLEARLDPRSAPKERRWTEGTAMRLKVPLQGIDGFVTRYHDAVGRLVFSPPFLVASVVVAVLGLVAFGAELVKGHDPFAPIAGSGLAGVVALVVAYYVVIFVHESSHALTCKHFGRMVPKGGFLLYYLWPAFYVDVTDAWLEPWRRRIAIFWAGPYSGFLLAGASALLVWGLPAGLLSTVLFKLAVAAYLTNLLNLMPFLLLDGYWILEQWLEIPQLRERALEFVKGPFWRLLVSRKQLTRREVFFAAFGAVSAVYTLFAAVLAIYVWRKRLLPILSPLWSTPGLLPKIVTTVVVVAVGVPLGLRYGRRFWALLRNLSRAPGAARRALYSVRLAERLRLLTGLGFLTSLPGPARERLALAARVREASSGSVIVRQGEHGHEFFVIAGGQAEVSVHENGQELVVAHLKPGEFFGERALLRDGIRTATVRATTPVRLLVFNERTFWDELAGPVVWQTHVRAALEERHRLAAVPLFADLGSRQLDLLAVRLQARRVEAREVIVREGEEGNEFYVVREGRFEVFKGSRRRLAVLSSGDFFGEIALVSSSPRTATVRALGPGSLWRLDRTDFHELLGRYFELEDEFAEVAAHRIARGHGMEAR